MKRQSGNIDSHTHLVSKPPVFILYSGHDSTIEPLATAIGVSNGSWPKYASRLVFELYGQVANTSSEADAYIRVLYNGKDVTHHLIFCKGHMTSMNNRVCPLKLFAEYVEDEKFNGSPGKTGYAEACSKGFGV
jgi:hypothetical protein